MFSIFGFHVMCSPNFFILLTASICLFPTYTVPRSYVTCILVAFPPQSVCLSVLAACFAASR
jgi:hypothetical protein